VKWHIFSFKHFETQAKKQNSIPDEVSKKKKRINLGHPDFSSDLSLLMFAVSKIPRNIHN
jgi:hypothetical protein